MDRRIGRYLLSSPGARGTSGTSEGGALVIVESRENFWLVPVIKNAQCEFPDWPLYVVAPLNVLRWLATEGVVFKAVVLAHAEASVATFNVVMFSPEFWAVIDEPFAMVFQCDTAFSAGASLRVPAGDKDFYGAACGTLTEGDFVINGGLSYRRVEAFRKACRLLTPEDRGLPEDVAFCRVMRRHPAEFRLPSLPECMAFAIESYGDPSKVVGMHGTDKGYAPRSLIASLFGRPAGTIIDCVSYDGEPILEKRLKILGGVVHTFVIIEARTSHSGEPKPLRFDIDTFAPWKDRIVYKVIDEFPDMPDDFGLTEPWIRPESREAWWREKFQRDACVAALDDNRVLLDVCNPWVVVADVDEIPDPAVLVELPARGDCCYHLDMAFLVHTPRWKKREAWSKAFVCPADMLRRSSPTDLRNSLPLHVIDNAGWHCSSFFDVDRQIEKIRHFAHREHAAEIDVDTIRGRFERGEDPYGRGPRYQCVPTTEFTWLEYC